MTNAQNLSAFNPADVLNAVVAAGLAGLLDRLIAAATPARFAVLLTPRIEGDCRGVVFEGDVPEAAFMAAMELSARFTEAQRLAGDPRRMVITVRPMTDEERLEQVREDFHAPDEEKMRAFFEAHPDM